MAKKPIIEDIKIKKVFHCPICNKVIGSLNSGILLGKEEKCKRCNTEIDWSNVLSGNKK